MRNLGRGTDVGHVKARRGRLRAAVTATLAIGIAAVGAQTASSAPAWLGASQVSGSTDCNFLAQSRSIAHAPDGTVVAAWATRDDGCLGSTRIEVAVGAPKAPFSDPIVLSDPLTEAADPKLAVDSNGTVIAVWTEAGVVRYSLRPTGGSFSAPQDIAGAGVGAAQPDVAISGGHAVVGWTAGGATEIAVKPLGSSTFGAVTTLTTPTETAKDVEVAIAPNGAAVVTWQTIGLLVDTIRAAARPAGGTFDLLAPIFTTAVDLDNVTAPQVEVDPAGRATLLWSYFDSASSIHIVKAAGRDTTGDFNAIQDVSDPTVDSGPLGSLDLAVDVDNRAIATWWAVSGMQAAVRPLSGGFGPVIANISDPNFVITPPSVAFGPGGRAVTTWLSPGGHNFEVQSAILPSGASSFSAPVVAQSVTGSNGDTLDGATPVGIDDQGNAATVWRRKFDGSPDPGFQQRFRIEAARLDAVAPTLSGVSIPSSGKVGVAVAMTAFATDRVSEIASLTWSFGDGTTAQGGSVTHTYTRGGTFGITVTATDGVGNASTASGVIAVPPVPGAGGGADGDGAGGGAGGAGGLEITGLRLSRTAFRAARSGAIVRPASAALRSWTRVTYNVNAAARVRFSFERPRSGRKVGSRCVKTTAANRSRATCVRYIPVAGSFSRKRPRGGDSFTFTGRLGARRLAAGRYWLVATPLTTSGAKGRAGRASFRIRP
jgi:hypothetical protein